MPPHVGAPRHILATPWMSVVVLAFAFAGLMFFLTALAAASDTAFRCFLSAGMFCSIAAGALCYRLWRSTGKQLAELNEAVSAMEAAAARPRLPTTPNRVS